MNRLYFIFAILFLSHTSFSQKGNSFLTHYSPKDERIDFHSSGMIQDNYGLIYFTNKKGVLEFDGNNWQLISTPGAVYTLSLFNDEIYVGDACKTILMCYPNTFILITQHSKHLVIGQAVIIVDNIFCGTGFSVHQ